LNYSTITLLGTLNKIKQEEQKAELIQIIKDAGVSLSPFFEEQIFLAYQALTEPETASSKFACQDIAKNIIAEAEKCEDLTAQKKLLNEYTTALNAKILGQRSPLATLMLQGPKSLPEKIQQALLPVLSPQLVSRIISTQLALLSKIDAANAVKNIAEAMIKLATQYSRNLEEIAKDYQTVLEAKSSFKNLLAKEPTLAIIIDAVLAKKLSPFAAQQMVLAHSVVSKPIKKQDDEETKKQTEIHITETRISIAQALLTEVAQAHLLE
jgi:hypothetical protein